MSDVELKQVTQVNSTLALVVTMLLLMREDLGSCNSLVVHALELVNQWNRIVSQTSYTYNAIEENDSDRELRQKLLAEQERNDLLEAELRQLNEK